MSWLNRGTEFIPNTQVSRSGPELDNERREASADLRKRVVNHNNTEDQEHRLKNAREARARQN